MTEPTRVGEIVVPVVADASGLKKGLDESKKAAFDFRKVAETALGFSFSGMVERSVGAVVNFGKKGREEFLKLSDSVTRLENNARRFGDTTLDLRGKILDYGSALEATTRFSDQEAVDSLNSMIVHTEDLTQAMVLNNIAADVAAGSKKNLADVAETLGRAMAGDERAILQLNKQFGLSRDEGKGLAATLTELETKFKGAALATDGAAMSAKATDDAWSNLGKTIAEKLGPETSALSRMFKTLALELNALLGDDLSRAERTIQTNTRLLELNQKRLGFDRSAVVEQARLLDELSKAKQKRDEILGLAVNETAENRKARQELERKLQLLDEEKRIREDIAAGMAQVDAMIERATENESEQTAQHQQNLDEANRLLEEQQARYEALGSTMANIQANEMEQFFTGLKNGTAQAGDVLQNLGRAFLKSAVGGFAQALIQEGAMYTAKAVGALISIIEAPLAPGYFAAGASLATAGGGMQAVAAGLKKGGVTIGGTTQEDTIPAILRKKELVAPLDDPKAMSMIREAAGMQGGVGQGGGVTMGDMVFNGVKDAADAAHRLSGSGAKLLREIDRAIRRQGSRPRIGG